MVVPTETGKILENNTINNNDIVINTNQNEEDENKKVIHKQQNGTESANQNDFNLIKIVTDFILNEKKLAEKCRKMNYENKNELSERIILGVEHDVQEKVIEKRLEVETLKALPVPVQEKVLSRKTEKAKGKK